MSSGVIRARECTSIRPADRYAYDSRHALTVLLSSSQSDSIATWIRRTIAGLSFAATDGRSTQRRELLHEWSWVLMGQGLAAAGALIGTRLLTGYISPSVFGSVSLLVGLSTLGASLIGTPLFQTALRLHADAARGGWLPQLRSRVHDLTLRSAAALVLVACAAAASAWFMERGSPIAILLVAGLLVCEVLRTFRLVFLTAARRQRPYALWLLMEAWARGLLGALAAWLWPSAAAVLAGYLVATVLVYAGFRSAIDEPTDSTGEAPASLSTEIKSCALPLIPLALVAWISALSDRYVLAGLDGLESAGLYAAAYGLVSRPFTMLSLATLSAVRPVYFSYVASEDTKSELRLRRLWIGSSLVLFGAGALLFGLGRNEITHLLLAERYHRSADLFPWLAGGFAIYAIGQIYGTVNLAHKRSWAVSTAEITGAGASLIIGIPLMVAYGALGAAIAVPLYYVVQLFVARHFAQVTVGDAHSASTASPAVTSGLEASSEIL
jgi:O-antigen/teichoic acid export membrane protein